MTTVIATLVFVLLVAAWWLAAARYDRTTGRTAAGRPATARVFGRGIVAADGTWRPVGLREPELDPGDQPADQPADRLTAQRDGVVL